MTLTVALVGLATAVVGYFAEKHRRKRKRAKCAAGEEAEEEAPR